MAKPVTPLPEWVPGAPNYAAGVYPPTLPWGDPHPSAGLAFPWGGNPKKDAGQMAAVASLGHLPNASTEASGYNAFLSLVSQYVIWVGDGTSAADETAHIVETDAAGVIRTAQLQATGLAAGSVGVRGFGTGSFAGAQFDGGPTDGPGAIGLGGGTNGLGVQGTGVGTGEGVLGASLGTGPGVRGISPAGAVGAGVIGQTDGGATNASFGVLGQGVGNGSGVAGVTAGDGFAGDFSAAAGTGPGLRATGNATSAALRLATQGTAPSTLVAGDVHHDGERLHMEATSGSVTDHTVHSSPGGFARARDTGNAGSNNNAVTWTQVALCAFPGDIEPTVAGTVILRASLDVGNDAAAINDVDWRIRDVTAGVVVVEHSSATDGPSALPAPGPAFERTLAETTEYLLPAVGPRSFILEVKKNSGATGTGIRWRAGSIEVVTAA